MKPLENRFNTLRQGRISARAEARQQLVLRNNLEKRFYKRLNTLFRDFIPLMQSHYKRIFLTMYDNNEKKLYDQKQEAFVFGRSVDFERLVNNYFNTRTIVLSGITNRMALRISNLIEQGRADNLTLRQITKLVSDKFLPISRSRAATIARTETHNAASFSNHSYYATVQGDTGIKMLKKWVATNDARTRPAHAAVNGQTVDMDEKFIVGGAEMNFAGDGAGGAKNVINCRCVIIYADEQDIVLD